MSLQVLEFEFEARVPQPIPVERFHCGVTGSGDLEVLMEKRELSGKVRFKVLTPVSGFDDVWKKVLARFVLESQVGDVSFEINDDNATPVVVYMRLRQALLEASAAEGDAS